MPREPADTTQISVRLPVKWLERLDGLAVAMSRPGIELGRADALRAAIARGMTELEGEVAPAPVVAPPTKTRKR